MNIWPAETEKPITIIAKETATITIYFKPKNSALAYQQLTNDINYKGNDTWEMLCSFLTGEYIIKTLVTDKLSTGEDLTIPIHTDLVVKDPIDIDIAASIRDLNEKITSTTSWNAVG